MSNFRFFATAILHTQSESYLTDQDALNITLRQPRGVAGCISPWNLPLYLFTEGLGKPILMVPIANHDDLQHAPDENLRVANLWYGIDLYSQLFTMPGG